jgi:hypothetical protein
MPLSYQNQEGQCLNKANKVENLPQEPYLTFIVLRLSEVAINSGHYADDGEIIKAYQRYSSEGRGNFMRFVDAHIHLSDEGYAGSVDEVISDAKRSNVAALVSNSVDFKTCRDNLKLAEKYPEIVYVAMGIHPWIVQAITEDEILKTL